MSPKRQRPATELGGARSSCGDKGAGSRLWSAIVLIGRVPACECNALSLTDRDPTERKVVGFSRLRIQNFTHEYATEDFIVLIIRTDEFEDITTPSGLMRVHLCRPAVGGYFPGVILYSEIYQVTAPIRRLAAMVAGQGYVVALPEVYHEYEPAGTALGYDQSGTDRGNALKVEKPVARFDGDADATLSWLARHAACSGRLGTLGVCLGGHLALRAALNPAVSAAACFYPTDVHSGTLGMGKRDDTLDRLQALKAETMFVFGRQDPHVPFEGRAVIRNRLEQVGASYEWHEVNAAHAFLRDEGPRYDPALFLQAMTWTTTHFQRHLAPSAA